MIPEKVDFDLDFLLFWIEFDFFEIDIFIEKAYGDFERGSVGKFYRQILEVDMT